jgi:squalene-hopene/tetraprenyl-beta-curcumene cyclase
MVKVEDACLSEGYDFLISCQREDGAFVAPGVRHQTLNYSTALSLLALAEAGEVRFRKVIEKAQSFLIEAQADEGEGYQPQEDLGYGGIGYGGDERPDLSNLHFALEALRVSGLPKDHPTFKKATIFLNRCQDIEGNTLEWVGASGGFAYAPDVPSNRAMPSERLPSQDVLPHGSMTFAGLKSLIFCNVKKDDVRVDEAMRWISRNYSVEENPNFGQNSIYYYYLTMAKALKVAQIDHLTLTGGLEVNWRRELGEELLKRQKKGGFWVNSSRFYMEGEPVLCTAYALGALNSVLFSKRDN